jgi:hypothetical protein
MVKRPEIYVGATKEAQAKTLWEQAFAFVNQSDYCARLVLETSARNYVCSK